MFRVAEAAIDWSAIPAPTDDGGAAHLTGLAWPATPLFGTDGAVHDLSGRAGLGVVFVYPKTGRPDVLAADGWDMLPGAKGCTPQTCAFRDLAHDLRDAGVGFLFGLSTQTTQWQQEAVTRLHLSYPLLSDAALLLADALRLPRMDVGGEVLLKRMALILQDGIIIKVFYPVFPPDQNAADVLSWLRER